MSKVIAEQQRKLTEFMEKIKVQENLSNIRKEQRLLNNNTVTEKWKEVWEENDVEPGTLVKQKRTEVNKHQ